MSSSNRSGRNQNSPVGYGRPPVNRQFKPGQSGNPKGRRKGRKNFTTMFADILSSKITVRDKNGTRTLSKLEAIIEIMTNKAMAGDPQAFAKILQTAEKLEAFKWQPPEVNHRSLVESALEKLERGITRLATAQEEEASSTATETRTSSKGSSQ
jgi:Family of unknown function (DUF5681)